MIQFRRHSVGPLVLCLATAIITFPTAAFAQVFASAFSEVLKFSEDGVVGRSFVPSYSGGLTRAAGLAFGPDGNLYVVSGLTDEILRYSGGTGTFLGVFVPPSGVLYQPKGLAFGPDNNLYVTDGTGSVRRFSGQTGAFMGNLVAQPSEASPAGPLLFGPDGNLYICETNDVRRFNGLTGASLGLFVAAGSGGLNSCRGLAFGPDGNLYVSSQATQQVLRYSGQTGAFLNVFISAGFGGGGLNGPAGLTFSRSGDLYVGNVLSNQVRRYNGTTGTFVGAAAGVSQPEYLTSHTGPDCRLVVQGQYVNGQALSVEVHLAGSASALPMEVKLWMDITGVAFGLVNVGADGTAIFPPGFDQTFAIPLGTVTSSYPRGSYQVGCRLLTPSTGNLLSESLSGFVVN